MSRPKKSSFASSTKSSKSLDSPRRKPREESRLLVPSQGAQAAIGLDLSLTGTGLVVWNGRKVLRARLLRTEPHPPTSKQQESGLRPNGKYRGLDEERIDWVTKKIVASIRKFQPRLVAIEGYSFGSNQPGGAVRHELAGVLKNRLLRLETPYVIYPPRSLKKWFTGSGSASKEEMVLEASRRGFTTKDDNLADAYALARYAFEEYEFLVDG